MFDQPRTLCDLLKTEDYATGEWGRVEGLGVGAEMFACVSPERGLRGAGDGSFPLSLSAAGSALIVGRGRGAAYVYRL